MTRTRRKLFLSTALIATLVSLSLQPALAAPHHHKHHAKHHVVKHHSKKLVSNVATRMAQQQLAQLGYYSGAIDGINGPQTRAAITHYQNDHSISADGKLGAETLAALQKDSYRNAAYPALVRRDQRAGVDATAINPDYTNGLKGGSQSVSSRFARLEVAETGSGADKNYSITVNGQPVLAAEDQPAIIGVSPAYDLGEEDAVVLTTFSPNQTGCVYRSHVLVLSNTGNNLLDIDNCTRDFQARVENGSLLITFPEKDDARAVGAIWRVEGATAERL